MQTSVEWLIDMIKNQHLTLLSLDKLQEQAKEMHKQEIMKSYSDGLGNGQAVGEGISNPSWVFNEEQYYQETFKKH